MLAEGRHAAVCIADLPPRSPSKARYLVKRLRAAVPNARIVVGRWTPPSLADGQIGSILGAGAAYVSTSLLETREQTADRNVECLGVCHSVSHPELMAAQILGRGSSPSSACPPGVVGEPELYRSREPSSRSRAPIAQSHWVAFLQAVTAGVE